MKKFKQRNLKSKFLICINYIAFFTLLLAILSLDSATYIPFYIAIVCLMWLIPSGIANGIIIL